MSLAATGAMLGLLGGGGLLLTVLSAPSMRRPRLAERVAPYVADTGRTPHVSEPAHRSPAAKAGAVRLRAVLGQLVNSVASVRRRELRRLAELSSLLELSALAMGAGEAPLSALARACALTGGEVARELSVPVDEARTEAPLGAVLRAARDRTSTPALARLLDQLAAALDEADDHAVDGDSAARLGTLLRENAAVLRETAAAGRALRGRIASIVALTSLAMLMILFAR